MNLDRVTVVQFSLADFKDELHPSDLERLASDEYLLGKLRDRFLDALGWTEAVHVAADVWKEAHA